MPVKPVTMPDGRKVNSSEKFELGRNFCNKLWQAATGVCVAEFGGRGTKARRHGGTKGRVATAPANGRLGR